MSDPSECNLFLAKQGNILPKLGILPLWHNTSTQMGVYKPADFVFFLFDFLLPSLRKNESNRFSCYLQTHDILKPTASRCVHRQGCT